MRVVQHLAPGKTVILGVLGAVSGCRWLAAAILSGLIAVETTYLYTTQRVDGPLWFEAGAAAALILAA
jgi:hypothetical protein